MELSHKPKHILKSTEEIVVDHRELGLANEDYSRALPSSFDFKETQFSVFCYPCPPLPMRLSGWVDETTEVDEIVLLGGKLRANLVTSVANLP